MTAPHDAALRALNRFGLGARIGEREGLTDPRGWLKSQLDDRSLPLSGAGALPSLEEAGAALRALREAQRTRDETAIQEARRRVRRIAQQESVAALSQRTSTDRPFVERLVAFWSNHLCISVAAKPLLPPLAGPYEREAIRPHVLGRFENMVLASARHPAMLLYLDNAQSVGPGSRVGTRTNRRGEGRGLNENYARELLELHTVGVNGGYDQEDVIELARALTGWTVQGTGGPGGPGGAAASDRQAPGFQFLPVLHEPGDRTVLGNRYGPSGEAQAEAIIRDLCQHPSTALFVAKKLVRHFVADEPPEADVRRIARVFSDTSGDLRAVAGALVDLESAWAPDSRKFRTPQDWLVAALRAFKADTFPPSLPGVLRQLRHPLWSPAAPKGYGDTRAEWADPDSLMNRAELARTLAGNLAQRGAEPGWLLDVMIVQEGSPLAGLLADETIARSERLALALGGPDFQWR